MVLPLPPIWHAAPPEVHSTMLNFGGSPAGIATAGLSWSQLAAQYSAGIAELEGILAQVAATYQGPSAEQFIAAHQPMALWMAEVLAKCLVAAAAHAEVVGSYTTAVATMPTMPELITNHVTHATLVATNFFGVNTVPIGMTEADYVRMWNQAADTMALWDGASTASTDSIPLTAPSPILLLPGVGEAGSASATAMATFTQAQGQMAGLLLNGADGIGTKLLAGKVATSPASLMNGAAADNAVSDEHAQQLQPDNMANSMMQQMTSLGPSLGQSAMSAAQPLTQGPQQLLSSAPQALSQAPQQLSQMLSQFSTDNSDSQLTSAAPIGFPATAAVRGINPAGMTTLASAGLQTGPTKPLLPSTWGAMPTTAAESAANTRAMAPIGASLPGASAGTGGGMMGPAGHHSRGAATAHHVTTYSDTDDADDDVASDGGTLTMTR